jgi:hypothetical protein
MNLDTVLMCAQMTARQQIAALGCVGQDVQDLIDELTSAPAAEVEQVPEAEVEQVPVKPAAKPAAKTAAKPAAAE